MMLENLSFWHLLLKEIFKHMLYIHYSNDGVINGANYSVGELDLILNTRAAEIYKSRDIMKLTFWGCVYIYGLLSWLI